MTKTQHKTRMQAKPREQKAYKKPDFLVLSIKQDAVTTSTMNWMGQFVQDRYVDDDFKSDI